MTLGMLRVTGAPGSLPGKTDFLQRQVAAFVERGEYAADDIVLTSFTRAAAAVLRGRIEVPHENVATLHSLARRALGGTPPIAEVGDLAKRWNELPHPESWRIGKATADDEDGLSSEADGSMLAEYSLARSKMLPSAHPVWAKLAGFKREWEDFKQQTGSVDFTDMIEYAITDTEAPYGNPPVLIIDEAQDLVPLQWTLANHWGRSVEQYIVAGDPAQAIYSFAGASPDRFLAPLPPGQQKMLPRSHRMARAIQARAERLLSRHSGTMMVGREYLPRDEEGEVRRSGATWRSPEQVVLEAEQRAAEGIETLIVATCAYMLDPAVALMRERGLSFHNPYRRSNGRWNPMGARRDGVLRTADRVLAFSEAARDPALWLPLLRADVYLTRGAKKALERDPLTWREWMKPEHIPAVEAGDTRWLAQHAMKDVLRPIEYASSILRRGHGLPEPLIKVGTIHSVKGGEADTVYVFPDVSYAGAVEMTTAPGRDAATRLAYVAMTRARSELVLCSPAGRDAIDL